MEKNAGMSFPSSSVLGQMTYCGLRFNSAVLLHPAPAGIPASEVPWCTTYGDGSPIDGDSLIRVAKIMKEEGVTFKWEKGDVIMIDNLSVLHSRNSFTPPRRVCVAMYS